MTLVAIRLSGLQSSFVCVKNVLCSLPKIFVPIFLILPLENPCHGSSYFAVFVVVSSFLRSLKYFIASSADDILSSGGDDDDDDCVPFSFLLLVLFLSLK